MGEFNYFDLISAAIILVSAYFAYARGIVRETMAIAVWVAAAVVGYVAAPVAYPYTGAIPVVGEFLRDSCQLAMITAFTIVFAITVIIFTIATSFLLKLGNMPTISAVNKGGGILFGALRGAFIVVVILVVNEALFASDPTSSKISGSMSAGLLTDAKIALLDTIPNDTPEWLERIYGNAMAICHVESVEA